MTPLLKNFDKFSYENKFFKFRPIIFEDIENIRNWRNDQIASLRQKNQISKLDQINYWDKVIFPSMKLKMPNQLLFCLEDSKSKKLVAYGGLVHIDWKNKFAESSFLTDTIYNENSAKYETIFVNYFKFLELVSKNLNLHCIYSETYSFRDKHIKILEKFGYEKYGFVKKTPCSKGFSLLHQYFVK